MVPAGKRVWVGQSVAIDAAVFRASSSLEVDEALGTGAPRLRYLKIGCHFRRHKPNGLMLRQPKSGC